MAIELMCRKVGMTQVFDESGACIPVTVLSADANVVVQKKTPKQDGYAAVQLGYGDRRQSLFSKAERGHYAKANTAPRRYLKESRVEAADLENYEVGQEVGCDIFEVGQKVDVVGQSKGRGFSGVVRRHGFAIKKRTHGTHEAFRHGGSIGAGAHPGHVIKGMKMPGQQGNARVTARNLDVVKVDPEKKLLFVRGGIPGHNDALVKVRPAVTGK